MLKPFGDSSKSINAIQKSFNLLLNLHVNIRHCPLEEQEVPFHQFQGNHHHFPQSQCCAPVSLGRYFPALV